MRELYDNWQNAAIKLPAGWWLCRVKVKDSLSAELRNAEFLAGRWWEEDGTPMQGKVELWRRLPPAERISFGKVE